MRNSAYRAFFLMILAYIFLTPVTKTHASVWRDSAIIDSGPSNAYRTDIAFDNLGSAIAVFEQKTGDSYRLYANRYTAAKGWTGPVIIDAGTGDAYRGKVETNKATGDSIAVFKQKTPAGYAIFANMHINNSGWKKPVRISNIAENADGGAVVFGPSGNAVAVF